MYAIEWPLSCVGVCVCVCVCVKSPVLATRVRTVKSAHTGKTRSHPSTRSLIGPLRPLDL